MDYTFEIWLQLYNEHSTDLKRFIFNLYILHLKFFLIH